MNTGIDDIAEILYAKYNIPKSEIAKILRSPWKVLRNAINAKGDKEVPIMYIGTFKPTPFRIKQLNKEKNEVVKES